MARFRAGGLKFFFRYIFRMSSSRDNFLRFYYGLADFTVAALSFSRFCTGCFYCFVYYIFMSIGRDYFLWFYYGLADFTVAAFSFSRFCTGWFY